MNPIPAGEFRIRPFRLPSDIQPLLRLMKAIEDVDQLGHEIGESALRREIEWHGNDPQLDRWIVESVANNSEFLGHAWTFAQTKQHSILHIAVHPDFRRRGLGSVLLKAGLDRAKTVGARQIVSVVESDNSTAGEFLKQHGFVSAGLNRFMTAPADTPLPEPDWPPGYEVRSLAEFQDISHFVEGLNICYSVMWGHAQNTGPTTVEGFSKAVEEYPDFYDPHGMFVIFDAQDHVCGICSGYVQPGSDSAQATNLIDSPAIAPAYQSLGLLRPLVLTTMRWLNSRSGGDFRLETWGDSEDAYSAYLDLGFTLLPHGLETEYLLEKF